MKLSHKIITALVTILTGYVMIQLKQDPKIIVYVLAAVFLFLLAYFYLGGEKKPEREPIPQWMKEEVLKRQDYHCITCSRTEFLDYHHRIAVAQGGDSSIENLVAICPACHASITRASQNKLGG